MPSEAAALEALDMAESVIGAANPAPQAGKYTEVGKAIDALVIHLREHGPMRPGRLAKEVAGGGWALGDPIAYQRLLDMIRYQCAGAKHPVLVRRKDGTIALKGAPGKPAAPGRTK